MKKDIGRNSLQNKDDKNEKLPSDLTEGRKLPLAASTEEKRYEELNFVDTEKPVWNYSLLDADDIRNFQQGSHYSIYKKMGSHSIEVLGKWGMYFCVWAPNATAVSVIGHFNEWSPGLHPLTPRWDKSGIWEGFIPGFGLGKPTSITLRALKDAKHKKAIRWLTSGRSDRIQPPLPGIFIMNGRIKTGCKTATGTTASMRPGVYTKYTWPAGSDLYPAMKNPTTATISLQKDWCPM